MTFAPVSGAAQVYFNPRSPCGERHERANSCPVTEWISIHAPRVGSDQDVKPLHINEYVFQSTLPVWGATLDHAEAVLVFVISIHAPRVGSDLKEYVFDRS